MCDRYVGSDAFPLRVALVWLYMLQPDRKLLVSAIRELPLVLRILNEVLGTKEATSGAA
jgi:hypothetical protein